MLDVELDGPERMIELIRSRQRLDGGFVELEPMRHSGTNPTAAAVGLLKMLGGLEKGTTRAAAGFLAESGLLPGTGLNSTNRKSKSYRTGRTPKVR